MDGVFRSEELLRDYSVSSNVMESYLDVHFQSFIFRVQIFHPNEVMEEANIFTDFSLKPIISHLGKAVVGSGGNGKETLTFLGALPDDQTTAKQVCDVLLQEDVALLSAINPYHKDQVLHLRSLWWAPQASALLHSLALKHTAFAGRKCNEAAVGFLHPVSTLKPQKYLTQLPSRDGFFQSAQCTSRT